jgi:hypothetical protein
MRNKEEETQRAFQKQTLKALRKLLFCISIFDRNINKSHGCDYMMLLPSEVFPASV